MTKKDLIEALNDFEDGTEITLVMRTVANARNIYYYGPLEHVGECLQTKNCKLQADLQYRETL